MFTGHGLMTHHTVYRVPFLLSFQPRMPLITPCAIFALTAIKNNRGGPPRLCAGPGGEYVLIVE